jgi:hypothetical protein
MKSINITKGKSKSAEFIKKQRTRKFLPTEASAAVAAVTIK